MLLEIFAGIVMIALGSFIFCKPILVWKLTEQWKSYRADEPSDLYLINTKIGGALFVILGVVLVFLSFIVE